MSANGPPKSSAGPLRPVTITSRASIFDAKSSIW